MSMPRTNGPGRQGPMDDDQMILIVAAGVALAALFGSAGLVWATGVEWLLEHHVLVGAEQEPLIPLPGCKGAGLDAARSAIAAGALAMTMAWVVSRARRSVASRRDPR